MNYNNAVIYKIVCNDLTITDSYVGSTTNFIKRKYQHNDACKTKNLKIYQFIREHGGWNNWSMVLVEEFPTTSRLLLGQRERYWFEILGSTLNYNIPARSDKEYRDDNKDKIVEYQKLYRDQNRINYALKMSLLNHISP